MTLVKEAALITSLDYASSMVEKSGIKTPWVLDFEANMTKLFMWAVKSAIPALPSVI